MIQHRFVERYSDQLEQFLDHMAIAFTEWRNLDAQISKDVPGAHVSAFIYGAFHPHVVAMKLLISGLLVPAGNSQRYVLESLAAALLFSKPALGFLQRHIDNQYSPSKAVRDVRKYADDLNLSLNRTSLDMLERQSKLYSKASHPTMFSFASFITHDGEKSVHVLGGCFDPGKEFVYNKEIASRVSLASIFPNIVQGVRRNYCGAA